MTARRRGQAGVRADIYALYLKSMRQNVVWLINKHDSLHLRSSLAA